MNLDNIIIVVLYFYCSFIPVLQYLMGDDAFFERIPVLIVNSFDKDCHGDTLLHTAVRCGSLNMIKSLVATGADINAKNSCGNTPLYIAASKGNLEIVKCLLESGADATIKNNEDITPYGYATKYRHTIANLIKDHLYQLEGGKAVKSARGEKMEEEEEDSQQEGSAAAPATNAEHAGDATATDVIAAGQEGMSLEDHTE